MFFLNRKEYRPPGNRLADYLPWAYMAREGIIQGKTGALQRTLEYRGPDLRSLTGEERVAMNASLNAAVMRLGEGWALFAEVRRRPSSDYRVGVTSTTVVRLVEEIRRENFLLSEALFETEYHITLVWTPPSGAVQGVLTRIVGALGGLFTGGEQEHEGEGRAREEALSYFEGATREFAASLGVVFPHVEWLDEEGTYTYLHSTISTLRHKIVPPTVPMYLDEVLADQAAEMGVEGRLGAAHLRVVSIKGYPNRTSPSFLASLEQFGFSMRLVTRFLALSPAESKSAVQKYQSLFAQKRKNMVTDALNKGQGPVNQAAVVASSEIGGVLQIVDQGYITAGYHTCCVVVWDDDYKSCQANAEAVMTQMRALGFACVDETANLKAAWLGTHPGNVWASPRRALVSSLNLSHMLPAAAVWAGKDWNDHLDGPPHMYCVSSESAPFSLNLNVGDVGHTMVLGPTGAGKSTLLAALELSWLKYKDAQVFVFDKGRSARASTLAAGGQFLELSLSRAQVTFQPLGRIDEPAEQAFALDWLEEVVTLQNVRVGVEERLALSAALRTLASVPPHLRTMSGFVGYLQNATVARALTDFVTSRHAGEGIFATVWDNDREALELADFTTIEMGELMDSAPRIVAMTLRYLFHRLEERFTGRPTLLVIDEAWVFLSNPMFAPRLKQWLKELRKYNVYVVFATQDVTDALSSEIAPTLIQNTATQILLPNAKALSPQVRGAYERLGLGAGQLQMLSRAIPKRQYYLRNALGDRLFELGLSPLELTLVAAGAPRDHAIIDQAQERARSSRRSFLHHYLGLKGFHNYAEGVR